MAQLKAKPTRQKLPFDLLPLHQKRNFSSTAGQFIMRGGRHITHRTCYRAEAFFKHCLLLSGRKKKGMQLQHASPEGSRVSGTAEAEAPPHNDEHEEEEETLPAIGHDNP
ncbi:hypothetical protein CDAR_50951 [Caerostris darwini]|uniref:Uncharacterized protein n=1 Tax=Caerostris darwini TaxID=1538125 RepID=A0AAV4U5R8_9ARAC|nr:hypothetical protein CDAR_50951 [Caerostris darwini]